jgi:hydroxymethylglutaryl-CoA reductase
VAIRKDEGSRIPGFHTLDATTRAVLVARRAMLNAQDADLLHRLVAGDPGLPPDAAERMVENRVGTLAVPLGIATNFRIDETEHLIPMATEEPSVIAAASNAARMARAAGGFTTRVKEHLVIGQVHLFDVADPDAAMRDLLANRHELIAAAEPPQSSLRQHGGGTRDLEVRSVETRGGPVLVVHLLVDPADAMGANAVNTRVERLAPLLEERTGGRARLRILSNLADRSIVTAEARFPAKELGGADVVQGILEAQWIAEADPYRAATHNKGIMNGIDAVLLATGNDTRAAEAGAHAYAARSGRYTALTNYEATGKGDLVGMLRVPLQVGTVGGATKAHPVAALALRILGIQHATDLMRIAASVGLAQNLAALRALATEGIQAGHMRLHKRLAERA